MGERPRVGERRKGMREIGVWGASPPVVFAVHQTMRRKRPRGRFPPQGNAHQDMDLIKIVEITIFILRNIN